VTISRLDFQFIQRETTDCRKESRFDQHTMLSAPEILNREFLEIRCKILELAAAFDRLDRAEGSISDDVRLARVREALSVIHDQTEDRAEQVQMLFSREYDDDWQAKFKVAPR
jgi:hypothetical protein